MDKSKPFGLRIVKKDKAFRPQTGGVFGSSDSDEESPQPFKKTTRIPQAKPIPAIKEEDASIYAYDEVYDEMKAEKAAEVAPKVKKSSRYIDHLLKAADKRKKEYERRVERKVQVEREKEGDEFEDKEMFVTSAYKKKLQEREEEEERERLENQLNDMMDVTKQKDLSGFYRHFLKQTVGEEKVPVIGEKFATIKEEPLSDSEKQPQRASEPHSDSEEQPPQASAAERVAEAFPEDRDDSDSDDSVESEPHNSYEKSIREFRNDADRDSENSKSNPKKKHSELKNSRDAQELSNVEKDVNSPDTSTKTVHEHTHSSDRTLHKRKTNDTEEGHSKKRIRETRVESDTATQTTSESNPESSADESGKQPSTDKNAGNNKNGKAKRDIYAKRTIDDVFSAAQARYFQRLALRSVS